MNDVLKYYITIFLLGTLFSGPSYAQQDEVHFGTIFVEDIEYENSEDNQSINHLTDQSSKQQQLETLYKQEIGLPNAQLKNSMPRKAVLQPVKTVKTAKACSWVWFAMSNSPNRLFTSSNCALLRVINPRWSMKPPAPVRNR
jgi:hypothetical protein